MFIFRSLLLAALILSASAGLDIRLQQVDRKISLQSQFVRILETLKFKNTGDIAVDFVTLCQLTALAQKTAYQQITDVTSVATVLEGKPAALSGTPAGVSCQRVRFQTALPVGEVAAVLVESTIFDAQTPFPADIAQSETQLVLYYDNVYIISPYHVSAQSTEVLLPSNSVKSYTDTEKPTVKSDSKVRYGRYNKVEPFTIKPMRLHYENQRPFRTVTTLTREITVSHWGNIYVEEVYQLKHTGAKHKGAFSRLKYAHAYDGKANSYQDLQARLPASAHRMYYIDIIGNISTSNTRRSAKETILDFKTRYPLMGGWKCDFTLGWSVPLSGFLYKKKSDGKYRLSIDFSTSLDDVFVQDMVVKVVLPEGSTDISPLLAVSDVDITYDKKYTYLDTTGRPVLVLHKKNVVPNHATRMDIDYHFTSLDMLREPLLLIAVFGALFALAIATSRLELTLARDDRWQEAQNSSKASSLVQQIGALVAVERGLLGQVFDLLGTLRSSEDVDAASAERASLEKRMRDVEEQLKPLLARLEGSKTLAAGVREVLDKVHGAQAKLAKVFAERVDLVKKDTPVLEVNKKVGPSKLLVQDAIRELGDQCATLFG